MRHFIVLGFASASKDETGESVYIGTDRGEAIEVVNDMNGNFSRRELFELAIPHIRRHQPSKIETKDIKKAGVKAKKKRNGHKKG